MSTLKMRMRALQRRRARLKRVRPKEQVTCWCGAYEFPHRIMSGHCNGSSWAESYFLYDRGACMGCNCNAGSHCEVATGQEHARYCEGSAEHLQLQRGVRHPTSEDEQLAQLSFSEEDEYADIPF